VPFIATLVFGEERFLDMSKIDILAASVASETCASIFFSRFSEGGTNSVEQSRKWIEVT